MKIRENQQQKCHIPIVALCSLMLLVIACAIGGMGCVTQPQGCVSAEGVTSRSAARPAPLLVPLAIGEIKNPEDNAPMLYLGYGGEMPFGAKPRPFVVKEGRVFVDLNDDGMIDAKDGTGFKAGECFSLPGLFGESTIPIKMMVVEFSDEEQISTFANLTSLEGTVSGRRIAICNREMDGRFGLDLKDSVDDVDTGIRTRLGKILQVGGVFYRCSLADKGIALQLTPYERPTATVRIDGEKDAFWRMNLKEQEQGFCTSITSDKPTELLPGKYIQEFGGLIVDRNGSWHCNMLYTGEEIVLTLKPGINVIPYRIPDKLDFDAHRDKDGNVIFDRVFLVGMHGERYNAFNGDHSQNRFSREYTKLTWLLRSPTHDYPMGKAGWG